MILILTGRTRYRVGWFGRLILQVEGEYEPEPGDGIFTFLGPDFRWRDARCEDFNAMGELFAKAPIPYPGQPPVTHKDDDDE